MGFHYFFFCWRSGASSFQSNQSNLFCSLGSAWGGQKIFTMTWSVQTGANRRSVSFSDNMAAWLTSVQIKNQHLCTWHQHNECRGRHPDGCHSHSPRLSLGHSSFVLHTVCHPPPPFALRSKAEAFDGEFQKVPLVLLASALTGRWQSNDNYSPHSVSLELASAANCALSPRRKEGFLEGQKRRAER